MIHLNLHFISRLHLKIPDSFQSSFEILATEGKILPAEFAIKISPVVGLRNRIIHRFDLYFVNTLFSLDVIIQPWQ